MQWTDTIYIFLPMATLLHYVIWVELHREKKIIKIGAEINEVENKNNTENQ